MAEPEASRAALPAERHHVAGAARGGDRLPSGKLGPGRSGATGVRVGTSDAAPAGASPVRLFDRRPRSSRRPRSGGDGVLVYDGDCGFCTASALWAARRFRRGERAMKWQLLDSGFLEDHGLSYDDVREAAWWVDDTGRRERGHRAAGRALQAGTGPRRVVGWFVLTPPSSWLAAGIYRAVVRFRHRLPGGTDCRV